MNYTVHVSMENAFVKCQQSRNIKQLFLVVTTQQPLMLLPRIVNSQCCLPTVIAVDSQSDRDPCKKTISTVEKSFALRLCYLV